MPRKAKGPRLYLRSRGDGSSLYMIRHGQRMLGTGYGPDQRPLAEIALAKYKATGPAVTASGYVYFITADAPDFPVKIGFTAKWAGDRIRGLQNGCPYRLYILGVVRGGIADEAAVHARFRDSRLRGEWFARSLELMDFIASTQLQAAA